MTDFTKHGYTLGALKDKADKRDFLMKEVLRFVDLPPVVDYETRYPLVRDQASRGACVAFASCAVKEYQELMQRRFKGTFDFSEEWLYELIREPGGGAYPRNAFKMLQDKGVPREKFMPYQPSRSDDEPRNFKPSKSAIYNASFYKASGYARLTTIEGMMQSLYSNGPFMLGVMWLDGWFRPEEKIDGYPVLRPKQGRVAGGHAICAVGYDLTKKLIKFRNSWSKEWGKGGYAYFSFDAINDNLTDSWASFDVQAKTIIQSKVKELIRNKDL